MSLAMADLACFKGLDELSVFVGLILLILSPAFSIDFLGELVEAPSLFGSVTSFCRSRSVLSVKSGYLI